jgi:hypothetical protein
VCTTLEDDVRDVEPDDLWELGAPLVDIPLVDAGRCYRLVVNHVHDR